MKKTKRLIVLLLVIMLGVTLFAGCGGDKSGDDKAGDNKSEDNKSNADDDSSDENDDENDSDSDGESGEIKGETYANEVFNVFVPEGWLLIPFSLNGEPNPHTLGIYKGAVNEYSMVNCPGLEISYPAISRELFRPTSKSRYDNVVDLPPLVFENRVWEAFTGEYLNTPVAILLDDGDEGFLVAVWFTSAFGEETISLDDADVLAIIASLSIE